jgi:WbqC-like protein family
VKLAIMQPYIFPYLGYFQLIAAVDKFVVYDDIAFIKQGWINRNYILLNGARHLFTIPVQNISSNAHINKTLVSYKPFKWDHKLLQTFRQAYNSAPYCKQIFPIIEKVITGSQGKAIGMVASDSIVSVLQYLSIERDIVHSHDRYNNEHLKNAERVIDICKKENADTYINAIGGKTLYAPELFSQHNISLHFLNTHFESYQQTGGQFVEDLSIIDVLMYNSKEKVKEEFLPHFNLI